MSARASRRRPRTAPGLFRIFRFDLNSYSFLVKVKVAFGGDDDDDENDAENNQEIPYETPSIFSTQISHKNHLDNDSEKNYQQAFFTVHNTTVEVIFENDKLSWSTVKNDESSRRKSAHRDDTNSVDLQDVYAISPIYTHWNWSLNVNESIAGTTVSTANTLSSPGVPSSSTLSQNSVLRGFQLHSYQTMQDNILQEILIIFQSNDSNIIERWYHFLSKIISQCMLIFSNQRLNFLFSLDKPPRHIFVLCNPYAGGKHTRHIYNTKLKPILERLQYKITYNGRFSKGNI